MAKPELGEKQICPNCAAKFYDLTRRPARCPKCQTEFDPEEAVRTRRAIRRSPADDIEDDDNPAAKEADDAADTADEDDGYGEDTDATPEIDEVDEEPVVSGEDEEESPEGASTGPAASDDDLGVDFAEDEDAAEEDDDVAFLEDDDEFDEDEIEGLGGEDQDRD